MDKNYDLLLSALPKWLLGISPSSEYFTSIFDKLDNEKLSKNEKKAQIKSKIQKDFVSINKPPKWLQNPEWKIINGKPLVFIGELDITPKKDRAKIYVFLNPEDNSYHIVNQAD